MVWLSGEKEKKAGWEPALLLGSNALPPLASFLYFLANFSGVRT
jgi:hypothetical protein